MKSKDPKRQCNGTNKKGEPCGRAPIRGGFVCPRHGGGAPQVRRKANERLADLIDPDRALREAARLAYSDLGELIAEGRVKSLNEWPPELRAAVSSFEVVKGNVDQGDGESDTVVRVKLWDKPKALEMLFKHLDLFSAEKHNLSGEISFKWQNE